MAVMDALHRDRGGGRDHKALATFAKHDFAERLLEFFVDDRERFAGVMRLASIMRQQPSGPERASWNVISKAVKGLRYDSELMHAFGEWIQAVLQNSVAADNVEESNIIEEVVLPCLSGTGAGPESVPAACRILDLICRPTSDLDFQPFVDCLASGARLWTLRASCAATWAKKPGLRTACAAAAEACANTLATLAIREAEIEDDESEGGTWKEPHFRLSKTAPALVSALSAVFTCPSKPQTQLNAKRDGDSLVCQECCSKENLSEEEQKAEAAARRSSSCYGIPLSPLSPDAARAGAAISTALHDLVNGTEYTYFHLHARKAGGEKALALLIVRGDDAVALAACRAMSLLVDFDRWPFDVLTRNSRLCAAFFDRLVHLLCDCKCSRSYEDTRMLCGLLGELLLLVPEARTRIAAAPGTLLSPPARASLAAFLSLPPRHPHASKQAVISPRALAKGMPAPDNPGADASSSAAATLPAACSEPAAVPLLRALAGMVEVFAAGCDIEKKEVDDEDEDLWVSLFQGANAVPDRDSEIKMNAFEAALPASLVVLALSEVSDAGSGGAAAGAAGRSTGNLLPYGSGAWLAGKRILHRLLGMSSARSLYYCIVSCGDSQTVARLWCALYSAPGSADALARVATTNLATTFTVLFHLGKAADSCRQQLKLKMHGEKTDSDSSDGSEDSEGSDGPAHLTKLLTTGLSR